MKKILFSSALPMLVFLGGCSGCGSESGFDGLEDGWPDWIDSMDGDWNVDDLPSGPCTPGEVRCNGPMRETCNEDRLWVSDPCDAGLVCVGEGMCAAQLCTPGERRCSPDNEDVVEQCNAAGSGWETVDTCEDRLVCSDGACVLEACTPGEIRCSGAQYRQCNEDGLGWSDPMDCPEGQACNDGACTDIICTPGEGECTSESTRIVCNSTGTEEVEEECMAGYICLDGVCRLQMCPPGLTRCIDDSNYEVCNATGTAFEPGGACAPSERCVEGDCMTACEIAEMQRSSIGCVYYAVDTNPIHSFVPGDYAVGLSNTHDSVPANVVIERKDGAVWNNVGSYTVNPGQLRSVVLAHRYVSGSAIYVGGAYRITSDLPIIAYQFNPLDGSSSYLSDASLLLPRSGLDTYHIVSHWVQGPADTGTSAGWPAHIQIAATATTSVTVTSSIATAAGSGVPALSPGVPHTFNLEEGDYLQLTVATFMQSFTGTFIQSDQPVAVFASNDCANVPASLSYCCCEHLEEQLFGLQTWGMRYVGSRVPRRGSEPAVWHIVGSVDGTNITFDRHGDVTGLPASATINRGERLEYQINGSSANPGDFFVSADQPIHVTQYMVGAFMVSSGGSNGDPSMVQAVPVDQFLDRYVVLVPTTWVNDYFVLTRTRGSTVTIDGAAVSATWVAVGSTSFDVARVSVSDGVHVLEGDQPFGVIVIGYDSYDSYAYPGGLNLQLINPQE